jgi:hypothetical protein
LRGTNEHPLVRVFRDIGDGLYPSFDGLTEVVPRPAGALAAVLAFTGHHIVAADVDHAWVAARCPSGDLLAPLRPHFLTALGEQVGRAPSSISLVLAAQSVPARRDLPVEPIDPDQVHPRVARAQRLRADVRVFQTPDGSGLLTVGRGLAGRWEAGFEVILEGRGRGGGRALAAASRQLIPEGDAIFMQVAIGNIASLRAILAAGFTPIGSEVLYHEA